MSTLKIEHITNISRSGEDLSIDTNGRVGIGSSVPAYTLDVNGNAQFTGDVLFTGGDNAVDIRTGTDKRISFSGNIGEIGSVAGFQGLNDAGSGLRSMGMRGSTLRFATGSAERLRIEDNAVGIGTDSPSTTDSGYNNGALHVHNESGSGAQVRWTNSTTGTGTSDGFMISKWSDKKTYITNFDDGADTVFTQSNSSGTLITTMTLDGDGDIGIGTTPYANARLTIGGTEGGGYPAVLQFDNNNTSGAEFFMLATDTNWSAGANKFLMGHGAPSSSNADVTIDSNGHVGIGTASPTDTGGFGVALDVAGSTGAALYLRDSGDSKSGTIGMYNSNLSINSRPSDGEISFYIDSDKQFKVMANGTFQAEDQNNRSAAIISPTNVVHTGAYPYHPGGDTVGNNQTNSLQMVFAHIYQRVWSSGRYMHIKTDIPVTGSNYGMVVVYAKGYRYSPGGTIDSSWGFHNWGTSIYSLDQRNYATTFAVNCYKSSDNYVVLVGDNQTTGTSYTGFQLSFLYSNTNYPAHTQTIGGFSHKVLAASLSTGTSGVY